MFGSVPDRKEEFPEFIVDVFVAGDSLPDFCPQEFPVAGFHAMNGDFNRGLGCVQRESDLCVLSFHSKSCEAVSASGKEFGFSFQAVFPCQSLEDSVKQDNRPAAFEDAFGSPIIDWFRGILRFRLNGIERLDDGSAAAFLRSLVRSFS